MKQCSATDLATPVNITYSPLSGVEAGTAPFLAGTTTTVRARAARFDRRLTAV
jgi:hypothetical protein